MKTWMWILLGLVVLGIGGAVLFIFLRRPGAATLGGGAKKKPGPLDGLWSIVGKTVDTAMRPAVGVVKEAGSVVSDIGSGVKKILGGIF